jgi:siroheme synthase-like protein
MSYFPFFVDLEEKSCLVVGGGSVAYRKVESLLPFGVRVNVVSPKFCPALLQLAEAEQESSVQECIEKKEHAKEGKRQGNLMFFCRKYRESDLEDVFFVIAATDDALCNREIARACHEKNILVNVVDEPELCSFYFPSLLKRGDLVAGVCSGGKSPVLSSQVRKTLEQEVPEFYAPLNDTLGALRPWMKEHVHTEAQRKQCYQRMIQRSKQEKRTLSLEEMKEICNGSGKA